MKNLTKGEMVTRIIFGVGIIVATFIPLPFGNYLNWVLAAILIITGITMYCPVCHIVDKS
jgi:hypothetical protein